MAIKEKIQLETVAEKETGSAVVKESVKSHPQTVQQVSSTEEKFGIAELVEANKLLGQQKDLIYVALSAASNHEQSKRFTVNEAKGLVADFAQKEVK